MTSLAGVTAASPLGQGAGLGVLEQAMRAALAAAGARLLETVLAGESGSQGRRPDRKASRRLQDHHQQICGRQC
ncbi:MAG TPA: hypothetical protein VGH96_21470 [Streptosporangiaceae bacterium]